MFIVIPGCLQEIEQTKYMGHDCHSNMPSGTDAGSSTLTEK